MAVLTKSAVPAPLSDSRRSTLIKPRKCDVINQQKSAHKKPNITQLLNKSSTFLSTFRISNLSKQISSIFKTAPSLLNIIITISNIYTLKTS